mgnify:CR=1 FL=1
MPIGTLAVNNLSHSISPKSSLYLKNCQSSIFQKISCLIKVASLSCQINQNNEDGNSIIVLVPVLDLSMVLILKVDYEDVIFRIGSLIFKKFKSTLVWA